VSSIPENDIKRLDVAGVEPSQGSPTLGNGS